MSEEARGETLSENRGTAKPIKRYNPGVAPRVPVRWKDVSNNTKLWFCAAAAHEQGNPVLFSLHFTGYTHRKMKEAKSKPSTFIGQKMRNYFPGNLYFFVVEASPSGVLHVHGVLIPTLTQTDNDLKVGFQKVCGDKRKISGKSALYFYSRKASHMMPPDEFVMYKKSGMYGIYGWSQYCGKDIKKTSSFIGGSDALICVSRTLNAAARNFHQECVVPLD